MSGHTMQVVLEWEAVRLIPVCHEKPGTAACRVECALGCETYGYPDHEHELAPTSVCNAVEDIENSDPECRCDEVRRLALHDGMPIDVAWDVDPSLSDAAVESSVVGWAVFR